VAIAPMIGHADPAPRSQSGRRAERIDFTYVEDRVDGICRAIANPSAENAESVEREALVPCRGTLSAEKARSVFGYAPRNRIEVGIPKYFEWYRKSMGPTSNRAAS
jgi:nucleoside-diphosphate-sugar epimerase